MLKPLPVQFTLDDTQKAIDDWGCNCGPAAIAAVTGMTLDEIRPHLCDFERKHYTNPRLMYAILESLGVKYIKFIGGWGWPDHGLVRVQWCGAWTAPNAFPMAKQRHTHWIGVHGCYLDTWIFDINCMSVGGWVKLDEWKNKVVPWLLRECEPHSNGDWYLTHLLHITEIRKEKS